MLPHLTPISLYTWKNLSISPGGHLGPATDASGEPAPEVSMIVKYNNADSHWEDELGRNWDNSIRFSLLIWTYSPSMRTV